jgi:hypothetical protein
MRAMLGITIYGIIELMREDKRNLKIQYGQS